MRVSASRNIGGFLTAVMFCLAALPVSADDTSVMLNQLEQVLPALDSAQREELLAIGELSRSLTFGDSLTLVPTQEMRAQMEAGFQSIESTVGMEVLFLIPEAHAQFGTEELASKLMEMSTLAGVEYYSESREKMRTLFTDSYTIDNPEDRNQIADARITAVPSSGSAHVYQRDTTFGWNSSTISFDVDSTSIHMLTINDAAFSWGFIPIIRAGRLHSHLVLLRTETFMIYYANFGAHAMRVNLFESRIHASFYNRLVALQDWFESKLIR